MAGWAVVTEGVVTPVVLSIVLGNVVLVIVVVFVGVVVRIVFGGVADVGLFCISGYLGAFVVVVDD